MAYLRVSDGISVAHIYFMRYDITLIVKQCTASYIMSSDKDICHLIAVGICLTISVMAYLRESEWFISLSDDT